MTDPPPPSVFALRVHMRSDWHVGTGAGRTGSVDRLVARDEDGLPFLPAKTLTGIWRDACEQVAGALDGDGTGPDGPWRQVLALVFGDQPAGPETSRQAEGPRPAALSIRPARLGAGLRTAAASVDARMRHHVLDGFTFVRAGVRICEESGRAMERHLRFEEVARAGCTLTTRCELAADRLGGAETAIAAWSLLVAGMRAVERLGAGRRRGGGRCRWSIEGLTAAGELALLDWLDAHPTAPLVPAYERPRRVAPIAVADATAPEWIDVPLTLRLEQPLAVADRVVGNVTTGLDHAPGRLLLPLVDGLCAELGLDVREAIGRGDLRVLPAYPQVDGARGRPVPLLFEREKDAGDEGRFHNRAPAPGLRSVRSGYLGPPRDGGVAFVTVPMTIAAHNTVDDDLQHPAGGGGVYSLAAIEAGTVLRAVIRCRADLAGRIGESWRGLGGERSVGRSRKDDFGLVTVDVGGALAVTPPFERRGATLRVWCLSDVLLDDLDRHVSTSAAALGAVLGDALGVRLEPSGRPDDIALRARRHDSWHARWAMPRASLVAIAAGSVASYEVVDGDLDPERARRVMAEGIGLRRGEGFGDIALNDPLLERPQVAYRRPLPAERPVERMELTEEDADYARLVDRAAWRSLIRATIVGKLRSGDFARARLGALAGLSGSQLGGLRVMVRGPDRSERLARVREVANRRERWGQDAIDVLALLFRDRHKVWGYLDAGDWPCLGPDGPARLRDELWEEAVVTLVDELARRDLVATAVDER